VRKEVWRCLSVAFLLCVLSLGALIGYLLLDRHAKKNSLNLPKRKRRIQLRYLVTKQTLSHPFTHSFFSLSLSDLFFDKLLLLISCVYIRDIKRFRLMFWLGLSVSITIYCSIFAFRSLTSQFMASKWNLDLQMATLFLSIIDLTSLILTPFFGWIIDATGLHGWLCIFLLISLSLSLDLSISHVYLSFSIDFLCWKFLISLNSKVVDLCSYWCSVG
jgi:hypothetical protein